jgi:hypothetical protein
VDEHGLDEMDNKILVTIPHAEISNIEDEKKPLMYEKLLNRLNKKQINSLLNHSQPAVKILLK